MMQPKKEIYNDVWFFYKKHLNHDNSDASWEEINKDGKEIIEKHNNDPFARSLVSTIITELATIKQMKQKGNKYNGTTIFEF